MQQMEGPRRDGFKETGDKIEQDKAAAGNEIGQKISKALVDNVAKPLADPILKASLGSLKLPLIGG